MLSDDVLSGVIQVTVKTSEITADLVRSVIEVLTEKQNNKEPALKHGKQSIKQLNKHGVELNAAPVHSKDLAGVKKDLKKYGIDFSVTKGDSPDTYTLFFKMKDARQFYTAFLNYLKRNQLDIQPSLMEKARKVLEETKTAAPLQPKHVRVNPFKKAQAK